MLAGVSLIELGVRGFQSQLAAVGHGVAGIQGEVHDDLLDLPGIGFHRAQVTGGDGEDFNVFADQPPQHGVEIQHDDR